MLVPLSDASHFWQPSLDGSQRESGVGLGCSSIARSGTYLSHRRAGHPVGQLAQTVLSNLPVSDRVIIWVPILALGNRERS